jgi:ketosteroid isomerase-like protein
MSEGLAERFAQKLLELERSRDPAPLLELFAENVELKRAPQHREYKGLGEAREFWNEYLDMFSNIRTTFDAMTESGDRAALEWHSECKLDSGSELTYQGCTVIETQGGRVSKLRTYYDSAAVLAPSEKVA